MKMQKTWKSSLIISDNKSNKVKVEVCNGKKNMR